jgi:diacylglycerol kinase (ATP)
MMGIWLKANTTEWAILALAIGFVFSAEAFNTALETVVDLVSPDFHPLAGITKDVAAGAVLLAAISSAAAGLIIFVPKIVRYFNLL